MAHDDDIDLLLMELSSFAYRDDKSDDELESINFHFHYIQAQVRSILEDPNAIKKWKGGNEIEGLFRDIDRALTYFLSFFAQSISLEKLNYWIMQPGPDDPTYSLSFAASSRKEHEQEELSSWPYSWFYKREPFLVTRQLDFLNLYFHGRRAKLRLALGKLKDDSKELFDFSPFLTILKHLLQDEPRFLVIERYDSLQVIVFIRAKLLLLLRTKMTVEGATESEETAALFQGIDGVLTDSLLVFTDAAKEQEDFRGNLNSTIQDLTLFSELLDAARSTSLANQDGVAGFSEETTKLREMLTRNTMKLEVILIGGMPGIGKTTLAREVIQDAFIEYCFHVRAWTCVSQGFTKRDLMLGILSSVTKLTDDMRNKDDAGLTGLVNRHLRGNRYLVVLDDMWDSQTWHELRRCFPEEKNGSRVLITGREIELHSDIPGAVRPYKMRLRTEVERWEIFIKKLSPVGKCPQSLAEVGRQIIVKSQGLPLAIVIATGLLKNKWTKALWNEVAESLNFMNQNHVMDTLALSYNRLPRDLKPCFLYLGAFPEDCEISVRKLIWLWIAEGLIHHQGKKSLEEIAEDHLLELLKRSLIIVGKRRFDGHVKTCRFHDLVRDFCLIKANEENFSPDHFRYEQANSVFSVSSASSSASDNQLIGSSSASTLPIQSLLYFRSEMAHIFKESKGICFDETYKSLRVLDLESVRISKLTCEILQLVLLRYLSFQAEDGNLPICISELTNLEFLIISSKRKIFVPKALWSIVSLRHIKIKSGENVIEDPCFDDVQWKNHGALLDNLQTIQQACPSPSFSKVLSRTRNLMKLVFCGPLVSSDGILEFPDLESLNQLQILRLSNTRIYHEATILSSLAGFHEMLKKLTLSNTGLCWDEVWTLGVVLPNLEVLKLKMNACIGSTWETTETEFPKLKHLRLEELNIVRWKTSTGSFPRLQCLTVKQCLELVKVPSALGEVQTLELIEVLLCNDSAAQSAREIKEEQESNGNSLLKVTVDGRRYQQ